MQTSDVRVSIQGLTQAEAHRVLEILKAGKQVEALTGKSETTPAVKTKKSAPVEVEETESNELDEALGETTYTQKDIIKAFQKFVKGYDDVKEGRLAAKKILKKFKVASVDEIDEDDFDAVMNALTEV